MHRGLLVLALAACGPARAPTPPAPTRTPYLMLFERGKTFTLPSSRGDVSCTVADVKQVGDANVSRLQCAKPHDALLISGTWVATPAGLYHAYLPVDEPDELALLREDELLIGAIPNERDHEYVLEGTQESVEAFEHEGSWCVRQRTRAGTQLRLYTLCFDGRAITGGNERVIAEDGTQEDVEFGKAPELPQWSD